MPRLPSVRLALVLSLPATMVACAADDDDDDGATAADTQAESDSHDEDHSDESTTGGDEDTGTTAPTTAESGITGVTESSDSGSSSVGDESSSTGTAAIDTWESWALPEYFEPYCIACHPGQSTRDFTMYDVVVENVDHIRCGSAPEMLADCDDHIDPGHLPIGEGPFPTDDERWRLVDWIDAGMPRDR